MHVFTPRALWYSVVTARVDSPSLPHDSPSPQCRHRQSWGSQGWHTRNAFLRVLESGSLRSRRRQIRCPAGARFLARGWLCPRKAEGTRDLSEASFRGPLAPFVRALPHDPIPSQRLYLLLPARRGSVSTLEFGGRSVAVLLGSASHTGPMRTRGRPQLAAG